MTICSEDLKHIERDEVVQILKTEPKDRFSRQYATLANFFSGNSFFKEQAASNDQKMI